MALGVTKVKVLVSQGCGNEVSKTSGNNISQALKLGVWDEGVGTATVPLKLQAGSFLIFWEILCYQDPAGHLIL